MKITTVGLGLFACLAVHAAEPLPSAKVQPVALADVRWTSGFWHDKFELCRTQMIPSMGRLMEGTNYTQFFRNFEIAAGLAEGRSRGASFNDGDFYKWIEGACATLAVTNDAALNNSLDRIIAVIGRAQRADGYLNTPTLIKMRGDTNAAPFSDRGNFEMYNFGHLFTTACVHHRITGRTNMLVIAVKAADFLDHSFSNATPDHARSPVCPSHYMGLLDLYRATGERRYLALSKRLFELRSEVKDGGDDNQDRIPFGKQTTAAGHAVRANYLFASAADLFLETGDAAYLKPLGPIWTNVVEEKLYITGGCGALYDGASPDAAKYQAGITRVHQSYGRNYQLPNTTAHNETCANIGNAMWNWRMFLATGEGRFMDVVELELYNAILSGGGLDGTNFFYTNPLRVTDPLPTELRWARTRVPFVSSFCCPPNLVRTIAESAGYAYGKSPDTIWVNLYGGSEFKTDVQGAPVRLEQQTEYPWNGRVRIKILEAPAREFALKLRIPGWAKSAAVRLNRQPARSVGADSYLELRREWRRGDLVDLDLPMPVRMMEANPLVEETLNQVAFQRGPVVYCLESPDLPKGMKISDVRIPSNLELRARYDRRLLGGVAVLEGKVLTAAASDWNGKLYREVQPAKWQLNAVKFIPYALWQNRGPSEMSVWLPLAAGDGSATADRR
ncbi:MAG: glycoside hydrolase family 127 protein [Verrucomicrobiota bacterium]